MNTVSTDRALATIADGQSDHDVIARVVEYAISDGRNLSSDRSPVVVQLRQSIRSYIDRFWSKVGRSEDYSFGSDAARELIDKVVLVLHGAIDDFGKEVGRDLHARDILIINTDSERYLRDPHTYFQESWPASISKTLELAVEEYYHVKARSGYLLSDLPLILPLVVFPSTEMLVAAARTEEHSNFVHHGKSAGELKQRLFGRRRGISSLALQSITPESVERIYAHLPEARLILRILSWYRFGWS